MIRVCTQCIGYRLHSINDLRSPDNKCLCYELCFAVRHQCRLVCYNNGKLSIFRYSDENKFDGWDPNAEHIHFFTIIINQKWIQSRLCLRICCLFKVYTISENFRTVSEENFIFLFSSLILFS